MPEVAPSLEISHRIDFSLLCNVRGYNHAVEVGVEIGAFARDFLSRWDGDWLYLVDDYKSHPDFPWDRSGDLLLTCLALMPYYGRFKLRVCNSLQAAKTLDSWLKPGFVYIDASHDRRSVLDDLEAWWLKLRDDGLLAGHDYDETHPGVVEAVNSFADKYKLRVWLTREGLPSWYVYKTEPEVFHKRLFIQGEEPNRCEL